MIPNSLGEYLYNKDRERRIKENAKVLKLNNVRNLTKNTKEKAQDALSHNSSPITA